MNWISIPPISNREWQKHTLSMKLATGLIDQTEHDLQLARLKSRKSTGVFVKQKLRYFERLHESGIVSDEVFVSIRRALEDVREKRISREEFIKLATIAKGTLGRGPERSDDTDAWRSETSLAA